MRRPISDRNLCAARVPEYSRRYILQHAFVQREVGDHLFQPGVLFQGLFQLAELIHFQPTLLFLSPARCLLEQSNSSEQLRQVHTSFGLLQNSHNLLRKEWQETPRHRDYHP